MIGLMFDNHLNPRPLESLNPLRQGLFINGLSKLLLLSIIQHKYLI